MPNIDRKDIESRLKSHAHDPYEILQCTRLFISECDDQERAREVVQLALEAAVDEYSVAGIYFEAAEIANDLLGDTAFATEIRARILDRRMPCAGYMEAYSQFSSIDDLENAKVMLTKAADNFDDSLDAEAACYCARECAESLNDQQLGLKFTDYCASLNPSEDYEVQELVEALALCGNFEGAAAWLSKYSDLVSTAEVVQMEERIKEIKRGA